MSEQLTLVCAPTCPAGSSGAGDGGSTTIAERRGGAPGRAQAADLYARVRVLQLAADAVGKRGDAALLAGVAAATSGCARALAPGRELALALASGARPLDLLHAADPAGACRIRDAAGLAARERSRGRLAPVVCVFDSAGASLAEFAATLSEAVAGGLAVVFVLECNLHGPAGEGSDDATEVALGLGVPVDQVDGMAPGAVERAVSSAVQAATRGGPRLIEALTFYPPGECPRAGGRPEGLCGGEEEFSHAERAAEASAREALHVLALRTSVDDAAPELRWGCDDAEPAHPVAVSDAPDEPDAPEVTLIPAQVEVSLADVA